MPVSTTTVGASDARKYMLQLCKHWSHKLDVAYDDATGSIVFDDARRCDLAVDGETLTLKVEAADEEALERTQNTVVNHLKRFAFREDFGDIAWSRLS